MTQNLTLVTQKNFGTLPCNFYQGDENEYYMTREQIGTALNYEYPGRSIAKIHERNADRLDTLKGIVKMTTPGGAQDVIVYTLRGVMEICRFSRQPNADKFMDFVWDVMESLYYGRSVLATPDQTSAVAMQTIQALVDSTLKTQAETTRCMVTMTSTLAALANHFTGAASQQPVTVAPKDFTVQDEPSPKTKTKSTSVPTPQKKSVSVAVTAKNEPAPQPTPVTWRDEVYHTMDKIIRNAPELYPSRRDIFNQIYAKMKRDYGFVQEQEHINYRKSHACTSYLSTIQVVESSTTYREIFDSILNDIYNDAIIKHVRKNDSSPSDQLSESIRRELGLIKPTGPCIIKKQPVIELDAQPVPAPLPESGNESKSQKPAPSQSLLDERSSMIDRTIAQAAALYGDHSYSFARTYRNIYASMNTDWTAAAQQFTARYHRKAALRKTLITYSDVLFQRFLTSATAYMNAAPKSEN